VLPFADLSPNGDQEYFSDGIAEEILNALTRVRGLKVASRTSAFGFKGQEALGMPLIAEKLQVRHVLEGSVRKSGNTIRIAAQIIDAAADQHLWSESYDRELTTDNIFTIQGEIASAIVAQLAHVIGLEDGASTISVKADTQNLGAYETYLEARTLFARRNRLNLPVAMAKLELTVATDPNFARAWALLAASYSVAPSWGLVDRDYVALSNRAAERAIQLNPDLSLPYAVLGSNLTEHPPGKFAEAFAHHEQALQRDPSDPTALLWRSEDYVCRRFFPGSESGSQTLSGYRSELPSLRILACQARILLGKQEASICHFRVLPPLPTVDSDASVSHVTPERSLALIDSLWHCRLITSWGCSRSQGYG